MVVIVIIIIYISTVEPLHNGLFGDRGKWPSWRGGCYWKVDLKYDNFF